MRHGFDEQVDGQLVEDRFECAVAETVHEVGRFPVLGVLVQEQYPFNGEPRAHVRDGHRTHQLRESVYPVRVAPLHFLHVHLPVSIRFDPVAQRLYRLRAVRVPRGRRVGQRRRR